MMHTPDPQRIDLGNGCQAIINGALVTAEGDCTIIVSPGAYVVAPQVEAGQASSSRNPREELYFSLIEAGACVSVAERDRVRLFRLLSQIASQPVSVEDEKDCRSCCTAMMESRLADALVYAARLASHSVGPQPLRAESVQPPGAPQRNMNDCLYSKNESIALP